MKRHMGSVDDAQLQFMMQFVYNMCISETNVAYVQSQRQWQYLDNEIVHNHMVKGAAEQGFQLPAALHLADNGAQRQAVPESELCLPAPIQRKPWPEFSMHMAGTKSASIRSTVRLTQQSQ